MPRYSRLAQDDFEDESASLLLSQPNKKRGRGRGDAEYIPLEDLSGDRPENLGEAPGPVGISELNELRAQKIHIRLERNRKNSRRILYAVMLFIFSIVGICVAVSIYRHNHRALPPGTVLAHPLDKEEMLSNGTHWFRRSTLVVALSGMHPHYLSAMRTPFLNKFALHNCAVPYMRPSFPSQSFPNLWSLATGLYPINHGIVGHSFYEPKLEQFFTAANLSTCENREFWGGEPIWTTLKKQNISSAVHMWPGADANWGDDAPAEVVPFNRSEPLDNKTAIIVDWLDREEIPQLMMMYVPNVDQAGHASGVGSTETIAACLQVDLMLQDVANAMVERNLTGVVNLVVVSDHGMAPTSDKRIVFLDDLIPNFENVTSITGFPLAGLTFLTKDDAREAFHMAQRVSQGEVFEKPPEETEDTGDYRKRDAADVGFSVYESSGFPRRWHFSTGIVSEGYGPEGEPKYGKYRDRLAEVYIVPEAGWSLVTRDNYEDMRHEYVYRGLHGYDNDHPLMRALFVAGGPAFPRGRYHPFDNVDLYSGLIRSVGGIPSNETDGNFGLELLHRGELGDEDYPGVPFDARGFESSTFDDFYARQKS